MSGSLHGRTLVVTGTLEGYSRDEAKQAVLDAGMKYPAPWKAGPSKKYR